MPEPVHVDVETLFQQLHQKYNKIIAGLVTENAQLQGALNQQVDLNRELESKLAAINPAE